MLVHPTAKSLVAAAVVLAFTPPTRAGQDETAIKESIEGFVASWNRQDVKAMSGFFAEDSGVMNAAGQRAIGLPEIQKLLEEEQRSLAKDAKVTITSGDLRVLTPTTAVSDFDVEISRASDAPRKVHAAIVHIKRDESWHWITARFYVFAPSRP
jgi:uncharacterized protein (TIGR02246 family)